MSQDTAEMPESDVVEFDERVLANLGDFVPLPFDDVADERRHCKERLVGGLRILAKRGLTTGLAGHITVRDPEYPDRFWVNPIAVPFSQICVSDLLLVSHDGEVLEGEMPLNQAAFAIHSQIHRAFPELNGACHSHSPYGRPWSATGRLIEPTSQDATAFYECQALFDDFTGVVLDTGEGERIAEALGAGSGWDEGHKIAILGNHGHLSVGQTVDEAVAWFVMFDQMCQSQLLLEATGREFKVLEHDVAAFTRGQTGTHTVGYASFQALWKEIIAEQPDLLE
jgi:ribulose-5-phosphate 4-epimerase/fuculose-1-phosphate aldolase